MKARTLQHIAFALFLIAAVIFTAHLFSWIGMQWMYTELPYLYQHDMSDRASTFLDPHPDSLTLRNAWIIAIALATIPLSFYVHVLDWTDQAKVKT